MVAHTKGPPKFRPPSKQPAPISIKDELDMDDPIVPPTPVAAYVAATPVEIETAAAEPLEPVAPPPAIIAAAAEPMEPIAPPSAVSEPVVIAAAIVTASVAVPPLAEPSIAPTASTASLDPSEWSRKTLELFNENAAAVFDFALALGSARSVGDAFELQSRFAGERYSSLVRQSEELAELTRRTLAASSPMRFSVRAFVA
jgi:cell division septation protein DedD